MTLIARFPDWMYKGLKLAEAKLPLDLGEDLVTPVIDITQGGRAFSRYASVELTHPASQPATLTTLLEEDEENIQMVWYMQLFNGTAGAQNLRLSLFDTLGTNRVIELVTIAIGANALISSFALGFDAEGGPRVFIPPGWRFRIDFNLTGVGESQIATLITETIPVGFRANL